MGSRCIHVVYGCIRSFGPRSAGLPASARGLPWAAAVHAGPCRGHLCPTGGSGGARGARGAWGAGGARGPGVSRSARAVDAGRPATASWLAAASWAAAATRIAASPRPAAPPRPAAATWLAARRWDRFCSAELLFVQGLWSHDVFLRQERTPRQAFWA